MEYKKRPTVWEHRGQTIKKGVDAYSNTKYYKAIKVICQALLWIVAFLILGVVGGIETGSIEFKDGGILLIFLILSLFCGARAVSRN